MPAYVVIGPIYASVYVGTEGTRGAPERRQGSGATRVPEGHAMMIGVPRNVYLDLRNEDHSRARSEGLPLAVDWQGAERHGRARYNPSTGLVDTTDEQIIRAVKGLHV